MREKYIPLSEFKNNFLSMDWNIFSVLSSQDIPQGVPGKNNIVLLVHNVNDGVGDYVHAKEIAKYLRKKLKGKNYNIGILLHVSHEDNKEEEENAKAAIKDLKAHAFDFCDNYWIFRNAKDYFDGEFSEFVEWLQREENSDLFSFIGQSCGVFQISAEIEKPLLQPIMGTIKDCGIPFVDCMQYGGDPHPTRSSESRFSDLYMGLPLSKRSMSDGVKVYPDVVASDPVARMVQLGKTERTVVQNLLGSQEAITPELTRQYLDSHHFMPGYLQNTSMATLFIVSQIYAWRQQGSDRVCDFLIPHNVVDRKKIISLLLSLKLINSKEEIMFFSRAKKFQPTDPKVRIRIASFRIEKDKDYQSFYGITADGAAGSGDSSTSLLISSEHFPFFEYKFGVIGDFFYRQQLIGFIKLCRDDLDHNDPMKQHLNVLAEYFELILGCNKNYLRKCPEEELIDLIRKLGSYITSNAVRNAWGYVREKIKSEYNIFNRIDLVLLYFTNFEASPDQVLIKSILLNTAEIQYLIVNGWISSDILLKMDINFFDDITKSCFIDRLPVNNRPPVHPLVYSLLSLDEIIEVIEALHELLEEGIMENDFLLIPGNSILIYTGLIPVDNELNYKNRGELTRDIIDCWNDDREGLVKILFPSSAENKYEFWLTVNDLFKEFIDEAFREGNKNQRLKIINILQYLEKNSQGMGIFESFSRAYAVEFQKLYGAKIGRMEPRHFDQQCPQPMVSGVFFQNIETPPPRQTSSATNPYIGQIKYRKSPVLLEVERSDSTDSDYSILAYQEVAESLESLGEDHFSTLLQQEKHGNPYIGNTQVSSHEHAPTQLLRDATPGVHPQPIFANDFTQSFFNIRLPQIDIEGEIMNIDDTMELG